MYQILERANHKKSEKGRPSTKGGPHAAALPIQMKLPSKPVIQREGTDFSEFLNKKEGSVPRNQTVPGVLVYGIEEYRGIQRLLGLRMSETDTVEIKYTYNKISITESLTKKQMLAYFKQLSKDRSEGGAVKAQAEARFLAINKIMNDLYKDWGKPLPETRKTVVESLEDIDSTASDSQQKKEEVPKVIDSTPYLPQGFAKKIESPAGTEGLYTVDKYNNYSWRNFKVPQSKMKTSNEMKDELKMQGIIIESRVYSEKDVKENFFSVFNPAYKIKDVKNEIEKDLKEWTEGELPQGEERNSILDYQKELLLSQYSPVNTYLESNEFIATKESKEMEGNSYFTKARLTRAKKQFELQTRRACKFGLDYAQKKNFDVAFMRDIINEDNVIENAPIPAINRVPITTSELRKQFRIENRSLVVKKAQFFDRKGRKTTTPWMDQSSKAKWDQLERDNLFFYQALYKKLIGTDIPKGGMVEIRDRFIENYSKKTEKAYLSPSELIWVACHEYLNRSHERSICKTSEMKKEILNKASTT